MELTTKKDIVNALKFYLKDKGLTQSAFARNAGVNASYISALLNFQFIVKTGGKDAEISDYHFKKIADTIGIKLNKDYWPVQNTDQLQNVLVALTEAKENLTSGMIIGPTGASKTLGVDLFCKKYPSHTYRLTVSRLHTLPFILDKLLEMFGQHEKGRTANKMERIISHLQNLQYQGEKVIIILDEAENLKAAVFGMVKAMYDGIVNHASIMLIGTPELIDKMERLKRKEKDGMPQFCRRFKAGTWTLASIDKHTEFTKFFDAVGIEDKGLRALLFQIADNYGELHDYLEPALKKADQRNEVLSEELFRLIYRMPKPLK